jgi:Flp pilus assembly protein TadG
MIGRDCANAHSWAVAPSKAGSLCDRMRRRAGQEQGSVLLLGIGMVIVCLLAIVVMTDVTSAFLQRRHLMAVADSAALAGAQGMDIDAYYAQGASIGTRLSPAQVAATARRHALTHGGISGLTVDSVVSDGVTVRVTLSAPLRLPFFDGVRDEVVRVTSTARLDYRPTS